MATLYYPILVLFILCCFLLILLVLIQKGRGGGLASAFGGGGGHTPFGTKTGDVLTWTTSILFGVFLLLAILLNYSTNARQKAADEKNKALTGSAMIVDESTISQTV